MVLQDAQAGPARSGGDGGSVVQSDSLRRRIILHVMFICKESRAVISEVPVRAHLLLDGLVLPGVLDPRQSKPAPLAHVLQAGRRQHRVDLGQECLAMRVHSDGRPHKRVLPASEAVAGLPGQQSQEKVIKVKKKRPAWNRSRDQCGLAFVLFCTGVCLFFCK